MKRPFDSRRFQISTLKFTKNKKIKVYRGIFSECIKFKICPQNVC